MVIDTTHLRLQLYAPEHLLALIEGVPQFEEQIGLRAADGLRDFIVSDEVSWFRPVALWRRWGHLLAIIIISITSSGMWRMQSPALNQEPSLRFRLQAQFCGIS
jgi:hypothetical protein